MKSRDAIRRFRHAAAVALEKLTRLASNGWIGCDHENVWGLRRRGLLLLFLWPAQDTLDLIQACLARLDSLHGDRLQRCHAGFAHDAVQGLEACAFGNRLFDGRRVEEQLHDGYAAAISCTSARVTAGRSACRTDTPHQPLSHHPAQRAGDVGLVQAEAGQPWNHAGGVVGVKRGQHEVTRHAGLEGNLRGFEVANLADENHVGILSKNRPQHRRERQVLARSHLNLRHTGKFVFDRIFHRHDVDFSGCELPQRRVERGRFSGPGRSCHDDQAIFIGKQLAKTFQFSIGYSEIPEQLRSSLAEHAYDGLLGLPGRHCRNSKIVGHATGFDVSPARVRAKAIRHIHVAHHFES